MGIAYAAGMVLIYLLVNVLRPPGSQDPATANFPAGTHLPTLSDMAGAIGVQWGKATPANVSFLIAIAACLLVWLLIWRTPLGYEIRAFGKSERAARYAGISPVRITVIAMLISGALAGLMTINNVMGEAGRLVLNNVEGAGFIGIAVALMGRSHPAGIIPAAILFGMLYQGGAELSFEMPTISRDMIVIIQGLVILFAGALEHMFRPTIARMFHMAGGGTLKPTPQPGE